MNCTRLSLVNAQQPVNYLLSSRLPYHARKAPQLCRELNVLYFASMIIKQTLDLEGRWELPAMKLFFQQEIQTLEQEASSIREKIQGQKYSEQFTEFMGTQLATIPRLYRQMAHQMRKIRRNFAKEGVLSNVEVQLDVDLVVKLHKAEAKYSKLWFDYKQKYLLNV